MGGSSAEEGVDLGLEGGELGLGGAFEGMVAGDVDVDDAAAVDVGWEEDGGKLDLKGYAC